jgi:hypothetical protein
MSIQEIKQKKKITPHSVLQSVHWQWQRAETEATGINNRFS